MESKPVDKEAIDVEFRMIISHAFLGCDTSDIDKETFDLAINGCVKYLESYSTELRKENEELKEVVSVCHDLLRDVDIYHDTHMEHSKIKECVSIATNGLNGLYKKYPKLFKITNDELNTNNA